MLQYVVISDMLNQMLLETAAVEFDDDYNSLRETKIGRYIITRRIINGVALSEQSARPPGALQ